MISMGNGVNISLFLLLLLTLLGFKNWQEIAFQSKILIFVSVSEIDVAKKCLRWKYPDLFLLCKLQTAIQINIFIIVCLCLNDSHHYFLLHFSNDESQIKKWYKNIFSHINLLFCEFFTTKHDLSCSLWLEVEQDISLPSTFDIISFIDNPHYV